MSGKILLSCLSLSSLLLLAACTGKGCAGGITHPPTDRVEPVFQLARVPEQCRVFAQVLITLPALQTGQQFAETVSAEARARGADMLLIGQSRQATAETELTFTYYPPDREYKIGEWPGWNFGFEDWQEQGAWANIGYEEWGNDRSALIIRWSCRWSFSAAGREGLAGNFHTEFISGGYGHESERSDGALTDYLAPGGHPAAGGANDALGQALARPGGQGHGGAGCGRASWSASSPSRISCAPPSRCIWTRPSPVSPGTACWRRWPGASPAQKVKEFMTREWLPSTRRPP